MEPLSAQAGFAAVPRVVFGRTAVRATFGRTAVCVAAGAKPDVEFVDMPQSLQGQYQSFTEARMDRLRALGYSQPFMSLEDGVRDYVQRFLSQPDRYR